MDPETTSGFGNSYSDSPADSVWIQKQQVSLETDTVTARVTQYRSRNSRRVWKQLYMDPETAGGFGNSYSNSQGVTLSMDPETTSGFGNSYSDSPADSVWIQKQQVSLETDTVTARVTQYGSRNSRRVWKQL
ncbi:hypothetical protein RRG08_024814 [Elysia crispata]|uniref:Uncharacterized protein n=1 Tax=Elysia crispata TaxID=231223 RepID=A0AAE1CZJ1_9GAST|nr:hypothetical protein RRG08_024814 [Elysia crispata]